MSYQKDVRGQLEFHRICVTMEKICEARPGRRGGIMYRIMIVEDDRGIAEAIQEQAQTWNLEAYIAENFRDILAECQTYRPHLILLDIGLPFFNGYHWCSEIRKTSRVPILFLSSASDNMNMVMAMSLGADDFIAKPFDRDVLMAKIQALLRRAYDFSAAAPVLEHRGAFLNTGDDSLTYQGQSIPLSKNEYRILLCLMENKGRIVSREKLMEKLWKTQQFIDENTLTVNVNRLRKKLDSLGLTDFISTKVGVGYLVQ